jgi:hypothetical protein
MTYDLLLLLEVFRVVDELVLLSCVVGGVDVIKLEVIDAGNGRLYGPET